MLEVITRTGTVYFLTNGRMERLPLWSDGLTIQGDAFKLHSPLSIGSPLHAYIYGIGNIRTTPVVSIVEYFDSAPTFGRST